MKPLHPASSVMVTVLGLCAALLAACSTDPAPAAASRMDGGGDVLMLPGGADAGADVPSADAAPPPVVAPGCNPLAITDECLPPYPNNLLTRADATTPTHRRLALPDGALHVPAGRRALDVTPFNLADGFPTSAPILVHYGVDVAPSALVDDTHTAASLAPAAPIAVFNMDTGARVPYLAEMSQNRSSGDDRAPLIIRPLSPMDFGARHVVVIRRDVTAAGGMPLPVSPGFVALRDHTPGEPRIEAARPAYEEVFTFLAAHGYDRASVGLAFDFTTASRQYVLGPALALRAAVFAAADGPGIPYTIEGVMDNPMDSTARVVIGTFSPPNYLQADNTMVFGPDGQPVRQPDGPRYPFTLVIPNVARTGGSPLPLTVFGHGVFGTGRDYLTGGNAHIIQPLAQTAGTVLVATDWIGLASDDQQLLIDTVVPDINRIGIVTDRLLQSLANNLALEELTLGALSHDPRVQLSGATLLDPARVYYYGVSLGGIQGSAFVPLSRHVQRGIFAVPGGSWSNILPRSWVYAPIKTFLNALYPDQLVQTEYIALLQGRFDRTDGVNLGTLLFRAPLPGAPAARRVLVQESVGDCLVPNLSTEILARAIGLRQLTPLNYPIWGLDPAAAPQSDSVLAQYALTPNLMMYTPPTTDVVPAQDNNTHEDMVTLPNVLHQVTSFLATGTVNQYCTAACVPN